MVKRFEPLLKSYGKKLEYDDSYEELLLFFVELVKTIKLVKIRNRSDGGLVNYIRNSIYHKYIDLSIDKRQEHENTSYIEDCSEYGVNENTSPLQDTESNLTLFLDDIRDILTDSELSVITLHFLDQLTIREIAATRGSSRQAVDKIKKSALGKIRAQLGVSGEE